ncbi:hypothetical protein QFZ82_002424 [Streptomyces sp. V4I23]|nr:hypothetical protein [Streptomyces sp. V4I23]
MARAASWQVYSTPLKLTARIRSRSSSRVSSTVLVCMIPAIAATMSSPPVLSTADLTCDRSVTSTVWVTAVPPVPRIRDAVSARPFSSMSAQCTTAPASASRMAEARPMPPAAPVTNAVRPLRSYAERPMSGPYGHI